MNGQEFRARDKKVQKLGRDGLAEQNEAAGEGCQVSQRTADTSFPLDNMGGLSSHEAVTELLSLMKENGRRPQAKELSYMLSAINNMDKQYRELLSTVRDMSKQLAEAVEQNYAPTEKCPDLSIYREIQNEVEQVLTQLAAAEDKIIIWAKTAGEDCRQMGKDGLNEALSTLDIRGVVRTLRKQAHGSAWNIIDTMLLAEKEGKFQSPLLVFIRPIRASNKILSHVSNTIRTALGGVNHSAEPAESVQKAHTEQTVQKQGKRLEGKPSIRQALHKNQAEIAAKPAPAPNQEKKQEAVL